MPHDTMPEIVTTDADLAKLCARLTEAGRFVFDTEFVAEESYKPTVCLIQVATEEFCALIDPLAGVDATPFWHLVADPNLQTLVHAGSEDLALCKIAIDKPAANVFDIQIAGGFVGWGYPISLSRIVRLVSHTTLHKSQTLSDWRRRPLTDEQIRYGAEDVIHILPAHRILTDMLRQRGRMAWVEEECRALCEVTAPEDEGAQKLRRLKGSGSLTRRELAIADALIAERDILARQYDRPARTIVKDHLVVELARRGWTDVKRMRSLRGLNVSDAGLKRMAAAIEVAKKVAPEDLPEPTAAEDDPVEEMLTTLASVVVKNYSLSSGVAHSLIANKADLRALVARHSHPDQPAPPCALDEGWRKVAVGELLNDLLAGKTRVRVVAGKGTLVVE